MIHVRRYIYIIWYVYIQAWFSFAMSGFRRIYNMVEVGNTHAQHRTNCDPTAGCLTNAPRHGIEMYSMHPMRNIKWNQLTERVKEHENWVTELSKISVHLCAIFTCPIYPIASLSTKDAKIYFWNSLTSEFSFVLICFQVCGVFTPFPAIQQPNDVLHVPIV